MASFITAFGTASISVVLACAAGPGTDAPSPRAAVKPSISPADVEYVHLPYGLNEPTLIVRTAADWNRYLESQGPNRSPVGPPCDLSSQVLVGWRAGSGSSGCAAPDAGIERITERDGTIYVDFYSHRATGNCMAYYRPVVAACLPKVDKPIDLVADGPSYIVVPGMAPLEVR